MNELLLPRTDGGVLVQAVVVFPALVAALFAVHRNRDLRIFVIGVLVLAFALFGLRVLH